MKKLAVLLCGAFVSSAWAATDSMSSSSASSPDSSSSVKVQDEVPAEHSVYDSKIKQVIGDKHFEEDKRINDLELRANAGSLNRYSLQFFYGYTGSPINDVGSPYRPNPSNLNGDYRTYMSGSANLRFRLDEHSGVNVGTGMSMYEPWQALTGQDQPKARSDYKNFTVNDPTVSIDRTYKVGATQMSSKLTAQEVTDNYKTSGEWAAFSYTQYVKWVPFQTRWILGFSTKADYFAYARPYEPGNKKEKIPSDGKSAKDFLTFIPSVEYKLKDNLNFNTSLGYAYYQLRSDGSTTHPLTTWRVGVGWAITHDIYFNPYINFFAETPALDTTNIAFNTTFSIF